MSDCGIEIRVSKQFIYPPSANFNPFWITKYVLSATESRVSVESFLILLFKFKENYYYQNLQVNCSPVLEYSILLLNFLRSVEAVLFSIWLQFLHVQVFLFSLLVLLLSVRWPFYISSIYWNFHRLHPGSPSTLRLWVI